LRSNVELTDVVPLQLATVRFPSGHPQAGEEGPVFAFAVRTHDGIVLVDTGVGPDHDEVERYFHPRRTRLPEALAGVGLSIEYVIGVVNTHLHFDHCGNNRLFVDVPIYVQRTEMEEVAHPEYTAVEWVRFPDARYEMIDGDREIRPDVWVLATPGHTPGHQSVAVATVHGAVLIAGQAIYTLAEWEGSSNPRLSGEQSAWDARAYTRSRERLRELRPRRVLFSHDISIWDRE